MGEPRRVTVSIAGIRSMTILEIARASAVAGVRRIDTEGLLRTMLDPNADPEALEKGALLLYAWAYQLEKRNDPTLTWDEAQTWRVEFDVETTDPIADAEADARVHASIATGLPPAIAEQLTIADMEIYAQVGSVKAR